jgi:membrane-bound metal-dependent hydrolase YbcI (DUF457 family)
MFVGHFAVAFAGKRAAPRMSLGALLFGAQFLDLIWPPLTLLGLERFHIEPGVTKLNPLAFDSYPISHSLLMAAVWAALVAAVYYFRKRYCAGALMLGAAVFSHWALDWITHRADLQLAPGSEARVGLGLWNHPAAATGIESVMFLLAVGSYIVQTRARDAVGRWGLAAFVVVTALIYVANLNAPPPPSWRVVAWSAIAIWLFVLWAGWVDRHREPRGAASP